MFKNSDDADAMKISSNVHFMNYHPAQFDNNQMYSQAVSTNSDGEHIMWTGSVYFIDLPTMQKVMTKYGYSFNLTPNNKSVMGFYTYNNFGGKTSVSSALQIFNQGKENGMKISPDLYIEVHKLLEGQDVTVQHGGTWNFHENVKLAKNLDGADEVAVKPGDLSYDGNVDVNKDGDYAITLKLKLADGEIVTAPAIVHVVPVNTQTSTNKSVNRTIIFHEPNGTTNSQVQSVPFVHTINFVNGEQSSDSWTPAGKQNLPAYAIPAIAGYHATINNEVVTEVPAATVSHDSDNLTVDVYYAPDYTTATESRDVTRTINLHQLDGSVVPTVQTVRFTRTNRTNTITGETTDGVWTADGNDNFAEYIIPVVAGYHATVDGQTVMAVHAVANVSANADNSTVDVYYAANVSTANEDHNVTRTINLHRPNGTVTPTVQTVHFMRTNTTTAGHTTYGDWHVDGNDSFTAYQIPTIAGYHATLDGQVVTAVPAVENVAENAANATVDIYYLSNYTTATEDRNVTRTINLHQLDGSVDPTVQTVHFTRTNTTNVLTGQVLHSAWTADGDDSFAEYEIPAIDGYHAEVNGDTTTVVRAVNNVAATAANSVVDIYYVANNNRPSDTTTTTETRAVTRTINLHEPGGVVPYTQSVHFNRTNTTTDGQTVYGTWTADGDNSFATYNVPAIAGYHATLNGQTITSVPAVSGVTADTASSTVDVYYVADDVQPTTPSTPVQPSQPTTPVNPSTTPNRPSDNHNTQPNVPTTPNKPSAQGNTTNNDVPVANQINGTVNTQTVATPFAKSQATAQQTNTNKQQTLPQTGSNKSGILGLAGLALAGLGMMLGSDKRRQG